ncbi:MAG: hypothetical protein ABIG84_01500 [archaeon]
MKKKAVSEMIGGVLFIAIGLAAVILVIQLSTPRINDMKDSIAIDQSKDTLATIDRVIRDIASEGPGSTRILPIQVKGGKLTIDGDSNRIYYEIDTNAEIISPRTKRRIGNLWFTSNTNASLYNDSTHYYLENEHLLVNITKYGSPTNPASMNPDFLIDGINFKDRNQAITDNITIHIDGSALSGTGYNYAEEEGNDIARATIYNIINTATINYTIKITLESGEDFIHIQVIDIKD